MVKMKLNRNESDSLFSSSLLLGSLLWLLLFFWGLSFFFELFQSIHGDFGCGGNACGEFVGSSSEGDLATLAFPDST